MKVVICNWGYSGYWAACWRELMTRAELRVFTPQTAYPYPPEILEGLPVEVLDDARLADARGVANRVVAERPDVLVVNGWMSSAFRAVAADPRLGDVTKVLIADTSWEGSLRQILARFRLHRYVKQFDGMIVGGRRGARFARWIGFPADRVFRSIYGYDAGAFANCLPSRLQKPSWPKRFCFVGRYAPVKGLDTLLRAYAAYRGRVRDPWPLDCYGKGVLADALSKVAGVVDHGFLGPRELPAALTEEGAFVFPSLCEPWGVALAEAAGAGLPLVCSASVTSGDDLVRSGENGFVVRTGNVSALCEALVAVHNGYSQLAGWGRRSLELAADFAPEAWADRWMEAFDALRR